MKKAVLRTLSYIFVAALTAAVTLFLALGPANPGVSKLDELEALILERFIGGADATQIEDAAADAMVEAIGDRWSYYIPADEYEAYLEQMNNAYVGVGITISVREDGTGLDITQVTEGGGAQDAGIQVGDILIEADGQNVGELGLSGTREIVKGEAGTTVELTVKRGEETLTFAVERRTIQTVVASAQLLEDGIGYVKIANFDSRCADETIAAIEEMLEQGATSLLFDVRYNPGGYKDELVKVLDYLLPEGPLFRSEEYTGNVEVDQSDASCVDLPMAVLVNGSSYSAAEFFAAALSEYGVATVVGTQTCGKGYFQRTYRLSDGSAVGLSVGKYTTPNGVSLADVGITPDIVVEVDDTTAAKIYGGLLEPAEDPQIQAAVEALS